MKDKNKLSNPEKISFGILIIIIMAGMYSRYSQKNRAQKKGEKIVAAKEVEGVLNLYVDPTMYTTMGEDDVKNFEKALSGGGLTVKVHPHLLFTSLTELKRYNRAGGALEANVLYFKGDATFVDFGQVFNVKADPFYAEPLFDVREAQSQLCTKNLEFISTGAELDNSDESFRDKIVGVIDPEASGAFMIKYFLTQKSQLFGKMIIVNDISDVPELLRTGKIDMFLTMVNYLKSKKISTPKYEDWVSQFKTTLVKNYSTPCYALFIKKDFPVKLKERFINQYKKLNIAEEFLPQDIERYRNIYISSRAPLAYESL